MQQTPDDFEESVLLLVTFHQSDVYVFAKSDSIKEKQNRNLALSDLNTVLCRRKEQEILGSEVGESTAERSESKRIFNISSVIKQPPESACEIKKRSGI